MSSSHAPHLLAQCRQVLATQEQYCTDGNAFSIKGCADHSRGSCSPCKTTSRSTHRGGTDAFVENNIERSSCKKDIISAFQNDVLTCTIVFQGMYGDICLYQRGLPSRPNESPGFSVEKIEKHTEESLKVLYEKISNEKFEVMFFRVTCETLPTCYKADERIR